MKKQLWIGWKKHTASECVIAILPQDVLKHIIWLVEKSQPVFINQDEQHPAQILHNFKKRKAEAQPKLEE